MEIIKGYKVFNPNWTARHDNFQYEVGKEYEMGGEITPCKRGFHFCEKLENCFKYYIFTTNLKVAEVEGTGQIKRKGNKICCSHIRIIKEIPMTDVLQLMNDGEGNLGTHNRGDDNRGNNNQGNYNHGEYNRGYFNRGYYNQGNNNRGDYNQGNNNRGDHNQGNYNQGYYNRGDGNRGDGNQGYYNHGYYNQGNNNRGDYNHGSDNIGIGNKGDNIIGLWCTQKQPFYLFNKLCSIPLEEFRQSENHYLLLRLAQAEDPQEKWKTFTPREKQVVQSTDNFTPEVFKELFDIDVIKDK